MQVKRCEAGKRKNAMAALNVSGEPPTISLTTDTQALEKLNEKLFQDVVHIVFACIGDPSKGSSIEGRVGECADQHGAETEALKNIVRSLLLIMDGAMRKNLNSNQIQEDLTRLGLNEERAIHIAQMFKSQSPVSSRAALGQALMVNQLVDMEWKFGVTAASSEMQKVGNTFLQLKLMVNKGNKTENIYMELTLPQFYSFLHEMERAKATLESMS